MNSFHKLSIFLLIGGLIFFFLGIYIGEVQVGFFLIFPFIISSGIYPIVGVSLILISSILFIFSLGHFKEDYIDDEIENSIKKRKLKIGGIVLIGPFPIILSSNWKITAIMIISLILILIILILLIKFF